MFKPNEVGVNNGNIFGFPYSKEESQIIIIPVLSDITCSYSKGTARAPAQILEVSSKLDFHSPYLPNAWKAKVNMLPIDEKDLKNNIEVSELATYLIGKQENAEILTSKDKLSFLEINNQCKSLNKRVEEQSKEVLKAAKTPVVLGGDHNAALGLIQALADKYKSFGILQIDAHADLRDTYEGFEFSHASIMFNALKNEQITKLAQVGIRDICPAEIEVIQNSKGRIATFFDWNLKAEQYSGKTWKKQCIEIINELPKNVYISFDIDGLDPKLCPNTGTPVPGGLEFSEAAYLLNKLVENGNSIIGADLTEVGSSDWDANVGARMLYTITTLISKSKSNV